MTVSDTLTARHNTHGDFAENARIAQEFKTWLRTKERWASLTNIQREALDVIGTKLSRILSGNADFADHWHDIAGYSTLAENEATASEHKPKPDIVDEIADLFAHRPKLRPLADIEADGHA